MNWLFIDLQKTKTDPFTSSLSWYQNKMLKTKLNKTIIMMRIRNKVLKITRKCHISKKTWLCKSRR